MFKKAKPQKYRALAINLPRDPFNGDAPRYVEGYYVKHRDTCINPIQDAESYNKAVKQYTKHYIFCSGFADWNLPQELERYEIDPTTLTPLQTTEQLTTITSVVEWVRKKLEEHTANIDDNGLKSLVLMQLIKNKTATAEQREEWDALVTERRAISIIIGLAKQAERELLKTNKGVK